MFSKNKIILNEQNKKEDNKYKEQILEKLENNNGISSTEINLENQKLLIQFKKFKYFFFIILIFFIKL